jgi:hypothetical protein
VGFVASPTLVRAAIVGPGLALALYISPEYALHGAGFSTLWLMWASRAHPAQLTMMFWRGLCVAAATCIVLASPLVVTQLREVERSHTSPARAMDEIKDWSPALVSFVTPSRVHPVYGGVVAPAGEYGTPGIDGMRSETTIALTVWALAVLAARRMRRDSSQFWVLAAGVCLLLTLGPFLRLTGTVATAVPLPYAVLYGLVPPLRVARDPTRVFAITILMFSILSAFGVRAVLARLQGHAASRLVIAGLGALVIFEGLTAWPQKIRADALINPGYDVVAAAAGTFAVLDLSPDQAALLAQTRHERPITAGRVSNPRAAAAAPMLDIERDFRDAAGTLALDPGVLEARLLANRQQVERLGLRFIVFPTGDAARVALAQRLGFRVATFGDRVVCERLLSQKRRIGQEALTCSHCVLCLAERAVRCCWKHPAKPSGQRI